MTAPGTPLLQLTFSLLLLVPTSYVVGRVHQWYTNSLRRDAAFREGYDHASHSMFDLAVQQRSAVPPVVTARAAPPAAARTRRHNADALGTTLRAGVQPSVPLAVGTQVLVSGDRRQRRRRSRSRQ